MNLGINKDLKLSLVSSGQDFLQRVCHKHLKNLFTFQSFLNFGYKNPMLGICFWLLFRLASTINSSLTLIIIFLQSNPDITGGSK